MAFNNQSAAGPSPSANGFGAPSPMPPQMAMLEFFFPGLSGIFGTFARYFRIDLNMYFTVAMLFGGTTFVWRYFTESVWGMIETHLMSTVDIRTDDELYNFVLAWISAQKFAQSSRRFIANANLNSRYCYNYSYDYDSDDDQSSSAERKRPLSYTPTFGSHYFWYKRHLLIFRRNQSTQATQLIASEREEISLCCFGRSPRILKDLLHEARESYLKKDEDKTLIYRGSTRAGGFEPAWQRCMARTSRPFSTVILNEEVKQELISDVTDYLDPSTRRWYSNRGIPYRRGYLLYGPPGTGKSSLSLALAGHFKMRIYIVSLSSVNTGEESLASLFAELPRRCVVLLEDIDTAGLTHTRDDASDSASDAGSSSGGGEQAPPGPKTLAIDTSSSPSSRLSLSGLLNILDGVASQEGRVLIMTTNHLEKLDKALIRPGRVDMIVKFDRADRDMSAAIFRAIFAPLEADEAVPKTGAEAKKEKKAALFTARPQSPKKEAEKDEKAEARAAELARKRDEIVEQVDTLSKEFAAKIPELEFSPAEIQGFLLKHKRHPAAAVAGAEKWVEDTRRERKEKEEEEEKEKRKKKEEEEAAKKKAAEEKSNDEKADAKDTKTENKEGTNAAK